MAERFRKIYVRMYADQKFNALSAPQPNAQSLWIFLLTGPHTSAIPGLFTTGEAAMAEQLNWDLEGFRKAFAEISRNGMAKADWKARVVWIPKAVRWNNPESPNVILAWGKASDEIPECDLKTVAITELRRHIEPRGQGWVEAFREAFPEAFRQPSRNQEQEQEQEEKNTADAVSRDKPATAADVRSTSRPARKKAPPSPHHAELRTFFCESWKAKYGDTYSFLKGKDAAHVSWILQNVGQDLDRAKTIVEAYLGDDDAFYRKSRHSLGILVSQFNRFKVPELPHAGGTGANGNGCDWRDEIIPPTKDQLSVLAELENER